MNSTLWFIASDNKGMYHSLIGAFSSFLQKNPGRCAINGIAEAARYIFQGDGSLPCKCSAHNCIECRHEFAGKIDSRNCAVVAILSQGVSAPAPEIRLKSTGTRARASPPTCQSLGIPPLFHECSQPDGPYWLGGRQGNRVWSSER
jgi:hypothetical protein